MASARLFRVILPVNDIETSATFYAALLDDAGMRVSPGRHYFDCGGVVLALYEPRADGDDRAPRPNWDHVYLGVSDLPAVFERARTLGGLSPHVGDGQSALLRGRLDVVFTKATWFRPRRWVRRRS